LTGTVARSIVAISNPRRNAMFARVTTVRAEPDRIEELTRYVREEILPANQGQAGFKGMYHLVDRKNGRTLGITLWETEDALRATEESARQRRAGAVGRGASAEPTAEVYEVGFQA
jgi:heme-degrading monooxygenase HmoA